MTANRIIFLDFDGVLNSWRWYDNYRNVARLVDSEPRPLYNIDPVAVGWLQRIVDATGAKVVISSTWRILWSLDELRGFLAAKGFSGDVIGRTVRNGGERGTEIAHWLGERVAADYTFVILDDDSDMEPHMDRLVQTCFRSGLQAKHASRAIELLMESS